MVGKVPFLMELYFKIEFSNVILSWNLSILQSLKEGLVGAFLLNKNKSKGPSGKINSLFVDLIFFTQNQRRKI